MKENKEQEIKYILALDIVASYRQDHNIPQENIKIHDLKMLTGLVREVVERKHSCTKCGQGMTYYENKGKF